MTAAAGPYLAACVLLAVAGVAKARDQGPTQRALAGVLPGRWTVPAWAVRAGGVAELAVAAMALATAAPEAAVAVGLCYLAFAAFVAGSLVRTGGEAGCGCFGQPTSAVPLGPLHVAVNVALAAAAFVVAGAGGLHGATVERAVVTVAAGGLAWTTYLVLVPLPQLLAAARRDSR